MGKWSEETRAAFRLKLRAAWAKKRGEKAASAGGGLVPATPKAIMRKRAGAIVEGEVVASSDLDRAIERLQADLVTLERAKTILLRCQADAGHASGAVGE